MTGKELEFVLRKAHAEFGQMESVIGYVQKQLDLLDRENDVQRSDVLSVTLIQFRMRRAEVIRELGITPGELAEKADVLCNTIHGQVSHGGVPLQLTLYLPPADPDLPPPEVSE